MEITQSAHEQAPEYVDHLATDEELGIEEIDRKQVNRNSPATPARPEADAPLTGVSVSPLDGIVVVGNEDASGAGKNGKKTTNRLQRKGL